MYIQKFYFKFHIVSVNPLENQYKTVFRTFWKQFIHYLLNINSCYIYLISECISKINLFKNKRQFIEAFHVRISAFYEVRLQKCLINIQLLLHLSQPCYFLLRYFRIELSFWQNNNVHSDTSIYAFYSFLAQKVFRIWKLAEFLHIFRKQEWTFFSSILAKNIRFTLKKKAYGICTYFSSLYNKFWLFPCILLHKILSNVKLK